MSIEFAGTKGRGFVNGALTWSFFGDEVNAISDADLLVAYCGWAWLFPAIQAGKVQTDFVSEGEEARLIARKQEEGFADIKLGSRFKIDASEVFEFESTRQGQAVKGAGDSSADVTFQGADPRTALPCIYFFLGGQVIQEMKDVPGA